MRIPINFFMTGDRRFKEINFHTVSHSKEGYIEATFYTPDDGEIDIMFRVHDLENGKDNVLTWTSYPTKYSHWIEMVLTSISTKAKLKEIIGMESSDLAEISFIGCNGTVSIGSMVYAANSTEKDNQIHSIRDNNIILRKVYSTGA